MKSISIIVSMTFMTIAMNVLGGAAQAQQNCPKAGELKNFAQIASQAEIFNGCEVTTDVRFMSIMPSLYINSLPKFGFRDLDGYIFVLVGSTNGNASMTVSVANNKADPWFNLTSQDSLRLRGAVDYRGGLAIFRVQSFEVLGSQKRCTCP